MTLLLAFIIVLIPLAIAPGMFFYFDVTPKIVVLLLGTAAAAIGWAAYGSRVTGFYRTSREAAWFLLALCGMALSLAVSTLFSVNPALSLGGSNWRYWGLITQVAALGLAYLVAECCAGRPDRLGVILRAISAAGSLAALYGIAQYFGWDPLLDARAYHAGEGIFTIVRPPATFGHADYFANWLLAALFAGVALLSAERVAFWKWLGRFSVALCAVAIVLSGTRAAMIGLLAGALFLVLWRGLRPTRRVALAAALIAAAAFAFYLSPAGARLRARVHWSLEEPAGGARLLLWRDSLRMAGARLPLGFGPETFISAFALHQSPDLSRAYPDFYHESPHNIVLDVLVSQGIAGAALLLALCFVGFAAAWKMRREPLPGALAAGLLAMIVSGQFACFMLPTALAFYVDIALLVALTVRDPLPRALPARRWQRWAAAVPCAAVLAYFGVRLWSAETALAAVRRALDANNLPAAESCYAGYEKWRWPGVSADFWYSRRLVLVARGGAAPEVRAQAFQQAILAARRAITASEAPFDAYYNLAAFYASLNDFRDTEQSLRAAVASAPNWFKPHWMLAQILAAAARLPEAEAEAATATTLDGAKHPEVTSTLVHIRSALRGAPIEPLHK